MLTGEGHECRQFARYGGGTAFAVSARDAASAATEKRLAQSRTRSEVSVIVGWERQSDSPDSTKLAEQKCGVPGVLEETMPTQGMCECVMEDVIG